MHGSFYLYPMEYEHLIPQRLDAFAFIIFLGLIQAFFFSYFLLRKSNRLNPKNKYLGFFLLIYASVLLEVFLCYTGLIVHVLWLVDYSESTNFLSGPVLYLLIISFLDKPVPKRLGLHLLPFAFYLLYMIFFFVQPAEFKFNAYIDAYYPEMPKIEAQEVIDPDPMDIKKYINEVSVVYTGIYIFFGLMLLFRSVKNEGLRFFKGAAKDIAWLRSLLILGLTGYIFWVVKSFTGLRDVQDHIGAIIHTVIVYFIGFRILQEGFIAPKKNGDKYAKSSLTEDRKRQILQKLEVFGREENYYLDNTLTMSDLAKKLGASPHHLSQVINEELGQSYGEYINQLRIAQAKVLLLDQPNVKIEEIAEQAGFNSKSTFNTAFKKLTGQTPSQYRNTSVSSARDADGAR